MRTLLALALTITAAQAAPPNVVTDIAPVHSLVASVMGTLGPPTLLIRTADDPHHMQLRPSQARALATADAIFWIGPALTPWLDDALVSLAQNATVTAFHSSEIYDPHGWLNPDNARLWLSTIAAVLADLDPENSEFYFINARATAADITRLTETLEKTLTPIQNQNLIFGHDAYRHLTDRFGLTVAGTLRSSDAAPPGAAHLRKIRDLLQSGTIACVFHAPDQPIPFTTGADMKTAVLDPTGQTLIPGQNLYGQLMQNLATEIADCVNN